MQRFKRTFLDQYSPKLRIFCLPKHRTKSPPMEGPHTNVGTWAPSYLATLLVILIAFVCDVILPTMVLVLDACTYDETNERLVAALNIVRCQNGGFCKNGNITAGAYDCDCQAGFTGTRCETS